MSDIRYFQLERYGFTHTRITYRTPEEARDILVNILLDISSKKVSSESEVFWNRLAILRVFHRDLFARMEARIKRLRAIQRISASEYISLGITRECVNVADYALLDTDENWLLVALGHYPTIAAWIARMPDLSPTQLSFLHACHHNENVAKARSSFLANTALNRLPFDPIGQFAKSSVYVPIPGNLIQRNLVFRFWAANLLHPKFWNPHPFAILADPTIEAFRILAFKDSLDMESQRAAFVLNTAVLFMVFYCWNNSNNNPLSKKYLEVLQCLPHPEIYMPEVRLFRSAYLYTRGYPEAVDLPHKTDVVDTLHTFTRLVKQIQTDQAWGGSIDASVLLDVANNLTEPQLDYAASHSRDFLLATPRLPDWTQERWESLVADDISLLAQFARWQSTTTQSS